MKYTERFKERIVQQMSGPDALSAGALCKEVGIPQTTLSRWLREACIASPFQFPVNNEVTMTMPSRRPQDWSVEEKLQVVLEAASVLEEQLGVFLRGHEGLELSGKVSKETIDFLTQKIRKIEKPVLGKVKLKEPFIQLNTICGIGKILSLTIMLETGSINRFPKVGDFVSYCRKVPTNWLSNGKSKGKGNKKNGNKYLAWAFSEVAELARRYDPYTRAFYNRKCSKTNRMIAHSALASKLSRAAYCVMRDGVPFEPLKLFA